VIAVMGDLAAEQQIRRVIEGWALWRDTGDFDRLRATWHGDGRMVTTWSDGSADEFVTLAKTAWTKGMDVAHVLGGSVVDVVGDRAIAQTRLVITQRAAVHEIPCDIECLGRFYDFFEQRDRRWGIVLRHPIYDRDRLVPVAGESRPVLDPERLARFPVGYRHLGYAQSLLGMDVRTDLPGRAGPAIEALYDRGRRWLAGAVET
jgi:hypothetical protein